MSADPARVEALMALVDRIDDPPDGRHLVADANRRTLGAQEGTCARSDP